MRIAMIVDDEPVSLMLMSSLLETLGWKIIKASSVEEAQHIISSQPCLDWLVLDDHLPDGCTEEVLDYAAVFLEAEPWIVRVSGADTPLPIDRPWHAFAPKPWSRETVDRLLQRWSRRRSMQEQYLPQEVVVIDPDLLPVFDRTACEKAFRQRPNLWFRMRDGAARRLPELLGDISRSLALSDRHALQHHAHEIRGMFKMLRSSSLAETARCLEVDAEWGGEDILKADLKVLEAKLPLLQNELAAFDRLFCDCR